MKHTDSNIVRPKSKRRMGWSSVWLLAFLFALPSCFEISCIKLTGCELLAGDGDPNDNLLGNTSGDFVNGPVERPSQTAADIIRDFVVD